jgi:hypothetical protein
MAGEGKTGVLPYAASNFFGSLLGSSVRVHILWKPGSVRGTVEDCGSKLRAVLLAALDTRLYRPLLELAELGTPESIAALDSAEAALARLPRDRKSVV